MMRSMLLEESFNKSYRDSMVIQESVSGDRKHYYLEGIFIEGDVRNANERIYPMREIKSAVDSIQKRIKANRPAVVGELDHPDTLTVNSDRISHVIEKMWVEGNAGYGRLRVLDDLPCGKIVAGLIKNGITPGVSSRGAGNVNESTGHVSGFEIVTVDIVIQPSAPNAYPQAIFESLNNKIGRPLMDVATDACYLTSKREKDTAEKFFESEVVKFIKSLKI